MKNWEKALWNFLDKYKDQDYIEGALLCGSYATGNQNEFSDIDVHILLSDTQNWRERGVVSEGGFLIEYFMNPLKQIRKEFRDDYLCGENISAGMFAYGHILFDKNGQVKKLHDKAIKSLKKTPRKWKKEELSFGLYGVWNLMDELNSMVREQRFCNIVYYELAKSLLRLYFKAKGIPNIPLTKAERILADPEYAKKYHIQKLPDKKFTNLFLKALYDINIKKMQKLYDFVVQSVGGFDISSFNLHSELEN